jgi:hypothetical protein
MPFLPLVSDISLGVPAQLGIAGFVILAFVTEQVIPGFAYKRMAKRADDLEQKLDELYKTMFDLASNTTSTLQQAAETQKSSLALAERMTQALAVARVQQERAELEAQVMAARLGPSGVFGAPQQPSPPSQMLTPLPDTGASP